MPQTREHLDICQLLGVPRGLVALTKCDAVDEGLRELASADVAAALHGTFLDEAPILPCSAKTGDGLPALLAAIDQALAEAPARDAEGLMRLPIDRVFSMKGFGTVVTGTLWAGRLRVGDEVVALAGRGASRQAKVRGLQVHGGAVEESQAGQRTAVNLAIEREAVDRGDTLVHVGALEPGRLLDVRLRYLPTCKNALKRRSRALVHLGTAQRLATVRLLDAATVEPGGTALAQLQLDAPLAALPGDRFILRGFQVQRHYGTTLGGGVVIRTLATRWRRPRPETLAALRSEEVAPTVDERVALVVERSGAAGFSSAALQMRVPDPPRAVDAALGRLSAARRLVRYDKERQAFIARAAIDALKETTLTAVREHHAAQPLDPGVGREALKAKVSTDPKLLHLVIEALIAERKLVGDRERVRLAEHDPGRARAASGLDALADRLAARYADAGLSPPRPAEVAAALAIDPKEVDRAVEVLVRSGALLRMKDLVFHRGAVDGLRARLIAHLTAHGQITAQEWKELVGATRKYAIPLAEHFDVEKLTIRVGEVRKLRGR
jgi:selenocysteine-specific elongation factor